MKITETMYLRHSPAVVFPFVVDLDEYPQWMRLVHAVEPEPGSSPPAWSCELRAKVGPFARSKRLRMVQSECEPDRFAAFERAETDGRTHARWAMRVTTAPHDVGTELTIELIYDGQLWTGGVLDRILEDEIQRGRAGLERAVAAAPQH